MNIIITNSLFTDTRKLYESRNIINTKNFKDTIYSMDYTQSDNYFSFMINFPFSEHKENERFKVIFDQDSNM